MRVALVLAFLFLAAPAGAGEPLHLAGAAIGRDGALTDRVADVLGNDGPSYTSLLAIDDPPLRAGGRIAGRVESFEVEGEAWIELAATFADGRREVVRTTDAGAAAPRLVGTAAPRPFALRVPGEPGGAPPVRLEVGVGMLGPGVVSVSQVRLEPAPPRVTPPPSTRGLWLTFVASAALAAVGGHAMRRSARRQPAGG